MNEFLKYADKPNDASARKDFEETLWNNFEFGSHPSEYFCNELLAIKWDWNNSL